MLNTSEPKPPQKRPAAFAMSFEDRIDRAEAKRQSVIDFLASGELYTTRPVVAALLYISNASAVQLLHALVRDEVLKVDETSAPAKLYGLSSHGLLALAESPHPRARAFELGRTAERMVNHHTYCQFVRIGYIDSLAWLKKHHWIPGNVLFADKRLKKIPDAMFVEPEKNRKTAIEIELHVKSAERMAQVVSNHLWDIKNGHYSDVVYHSPYPEAMRSVLDRAVRSINFSAATLFTVRDLPPKSADAKGVFAEKNPLDDHSIFDRLEDYDDE